MVFLRVRAKVKNPGPEGPALGYPWKGIVYRPLFLEYWSGGVLKKQRTRNLGTCCDLEKHCFPLTSS
jgi:hypothetical protein